MKKCERSYFFGSPENKIYVQEWGPIDKPVVLLLHGFPGCADHGQLLSQTPLWNSFRLLAIDRPGYGQSAQQKKLTPLKLAVQIENLLNDLKIQKLSIISVSGGAPYAMATAYLLKDKVVKLVSLGGIAPLNLKNFKFMNATQKKIWFLRQVVPEAVLEYSLNRLLTQGLAKLDETLFTEMDSFSEQDQKIFQDPLINPVLIKTLKSSLENGPAGLITDMKIYSRSWGFSLKSVTCPVSLWHGGQDVVVHSRFAQDMQNWLPMAKLKIIKNEGHYSLLYNCRDAILEDALIF